jgi:hypothetical protein
VIKLQPQAQLHPTFDGGAAKLRHVNFTAYERFMTAIEVA